ncbi:hypothetical protein HK103_004069 [Boothiomyces macroporosus]|uniref:Uncharacterized protein n=1 Tax=Boothiomyces macroporosus TaxID=261099 RepID=A0AAD5Y640_9FUNG|nr:hypothetical protein HK103_004069 [Boothiomyces macroporosus]
MQVDQLIFYSNEILKTNTTDSDVEISLKIKQSIQYLEYALRLNPQPFQRLAVTFQLATMYTRYTQNKEIADKLITKGILDSKIISEEYHLKFLQLQSELYPKSKKVESASSHPSNIEILFLQILGLIINGEYKQAHQQLPILHSTIEQQSECKWYIIGYILSSLSQCKTDIQKSFMYLNEGRKFVLIEARKQKAFLDPIAMLEYKRFLKNSIHFMNLLQVDLHIATSDYISAFNILEGMEIDDLALIQVNRLFRILNIDELGESSRIETKLMKTLKEALASTNTNETKKLVFDVIKVSQDHQLTAIALFILGNLYQFTTPNLSKSSLEKCRALCDLVGFQELRNKCDSINSNKEYSRSFILQKLESL